MNEDQVTTLLDRLAGDVDVSHPPVAETADAGRRRLRWRHRAQVGGAAAIVLAIAGGGLAIQQQLTADARPATQPTNRPPVVGPSIDSPTMPGHAPNEAQLRGQWQPVSLGQDSIVLSANPYPGQTLFFGRYLGSFGWQGTDGCNGWGGRVRLGADGAFSTSENAHTRVFCHIAGTEVEAVLKADYVRLVGGRLALYDSSSNRLAVFVRSYSTRPPPDPAQLPGTVPTEAQLFAPGKWFGPIGSVASKLGSETTKTAVAFSHRTTTSAPANLTFLTWSGYDGCNWVNGVARLTSDGHLTTSGVSSTLRGCIWPNGAQIHRVSSIDLLQAARQMRLVEGNLQFYDDAGELLGILEPFTP